MRCSVLRCVAVCCSILQCAVYRSALQCVVALQHVRAHRSDISLAPLSRVYFNCSPGTIFRASTVGISSAFLPFETASDVPRDPMKTNPSSVSTCVHEVCVCERERDGERERKREKGRERFFFGTDTDMDRHWHENGHRYRRRHEAGGGET